MHTGKDNRRQIPWKRLFSGLLAWMLILAVLQPLADTELAAAAGPSGDHLCPHHPVHTKDCGYQEGTGSMSCNHIHNNECVQAEAGEGTPCTHVHDETCGYTEGTEETGHPCTFVCDLCVTGWEWDDEEEYLIRDDETK